MKIDPPNNDSFDRNRFRKLRQGPRLKKNREPADPLKMSQAMKKALKDVEKKSDE